jgi:hypothetical protein
MKILISGAQQYQESPTSRLALFLRNQITKLIAIPFVAQLAVGRESRDRIELPEY